MDFGIRSIRTTEKLIYFWIAPKRQFKVLVKSTLANKQLLCNDDFIFFQQQTRFLESSTFRCVFMSLAQTLKATKFWKISMAWHDTNFKFQKVKHQRLKMELNKIGETFTFTLLLGNSVALNLFSIYFHTRDEDFFYHLKRSNFVRKLVYRYALFLITPK
jgi:hypothetical protein